MMNEMRAACGTYRMQGKCVQGFNEKNFEEREHLEFLGIDRRIILKW